MSTIGKSIAHGLSYLLLFASLVTAIQQCQDDAYETEEEGLIRESHERNRALNERWKNDPAFRDSVRVAVGAWYQPSASEVVQDSTAVE